MIDVEREQLIPFRQARSEFPGKRVCIATLFRWISRGCRGVKLDSLLIGQARFTSKEAISRFIAAQNAPDAPPVVTPAQRRRQSEAARKTLQEMGI